MKKVILLLLPLTAIILYVVINLINKPKNYPKIVTNDYHPSPQNEITLEPVTTQSEILPDYHLIKTSFIPQAPEKNWSQPWQDTCEEAAILTVKYYYDHQSPDNDQIITDLKSIISFEAEAGFTRDVNLAQMATISASMFNLRSLIINNPTTDIIRKYLSQNIPIIVPANGKVLFKENTHFKSGGPWYHNLVVLGYDDNRRQFIVHDVGTQFGAYFRYSYQTLLDSIHDFPPSGIKEDINSGAKNVLILLK